MLPTYNFSLSTVSDRRKAVILHLSFLAFLATLPLSGSDVQRASPPTFRVSAQMVLVPVTVTDRYGKTIEGLRAQNFTVLDDQTPQQISSFTSEDAPCSVGLVLDISGSMRNALITAKKVAQAFFSTANRDDEFLMLTVSTRPNDLLGFTTDTEALEQNIQSTRPGGMTALIDTVYLGLRRMREATRPRRALLILSDGMDNHSQRSKGDLMRVALEADVQVYTILVDGLDGGSDRSLFCPSMIAKPGDQAAGRLGHHILQELAHKTGGLHFHVRSDTEAKEAAISVGRALRNEYMIGYQPPDSGTVGKWHRVNVKSNVPNVNVYGRNGYFSR
jgi:Ca-activated chloride channel family protein